MKLETIYILTLIITISAIDDYVSLNSVNKKVISSHITPQRRKSNLFPKSLKKFTVTTPAVITKPVNFKQGTTTRVLMKKISPLFRTTESPFRYTRPMSRKPFLKVKKFTIDLSTKSWKNEIVQRNHNSENSDEHSNFDEEILSTESSDEIRNEDHVTVIDEIDDDDKLSHTTKSTISPNKIRSSLNTIQLLDTKRMKRNEEISRTNFESYSSEEAKDLNEYIFLPKLVQSMRNEDLFSNPIEENSSF